MAEHNKKDYICKQCGAVDTLKSFKTNWPMVMNCFKCKAGQGVKLEEMLAQRIGMYPVVTEEPSEVEEQATA